MQPPKGEGIPTTPTSLTSGVDEDTTVSNNEVWEVEDFTTGLGLRNPRWRKPFIEEEDLMKPMKPFTKSAPPVGFNSGITVASSLAEKPTSTLIAAIDSATKFSSKCPDLPSLAFQQYFWKGLETVGTKAKRSLSPNSATLEKGVKMGWEDPSWLREKIGPGTCTNGIEVVGKENLETCAVGEEEVCTDDARAKESHPKNAGIKSNPMYDWTGLERELERPPKTVDQIWPLKMSPPGWGERSDHDLDLELHPDLRPTLHPHQKPMRAQDQNPQQASLHWA
jgi:hypothetical protein